MTNHTNLQLSGADGRPFLLDLHLPEAPAGAAPVVVFAHGFKGFKDWGHWHLIADKMTAAGFAFAKFNFSHNGTTVDQPTDFADLDAFAANNYTKELADLDAVFQWLQQEAGAYGLDTDKIALIGHSRGGGLGVIYAHRNPRVRRLITWAAVSSLDYFWKDQPQLVRQWREKDVHFMLNSRTGQQLPLGYQLYEDVKDNAAAYDIRRIVAGLSIPLLIVHGTDDPSVPAASALQLHSWAPGSQLALVEGADHVFGASHPYTAATLPPHSEALVSRTLDFLAPLRE